MPDESAPHPALDDLFNTDLTITSIEVGRFGTGQFDCRIRRNQPTHVIRGYGPTIDAAIRAALSLYRGHIECGGSVR